MFFRIKFTFPLVKSIDLYDNIKDSRLALCNMTNREVTQWIKIPLSNF